ncbi:branched chain amino acid aminotransferase [bacterium]|nr:MAG: branched chain amino acid aminotransferase [bacterium]
MSKVGKGPSADFIWMNGKMVAWDDANIHVLSHVIHYGSGVFEGCRVYETPQGPAMLRMADHTRRLLHSAKMLRMEPRWSHQELLQAIRDTVHANKLKSCYVRPVIYRGLGPAGVNPLGNEIDAFIAVWPWGKYLGEEALNEGVDVCISSFRRMAPDTHLPMGKVVGNYVNSQYAKMEAVLNGFAEGILLDGTGNISEGSGENLFIVRDGKIMTPGFGSSVLGGITRDCIIKLAAEQGIEVSEQSIPREMLYVADEAFFTGTAAEVTPIRSVDRMPVGDGKRGPITESLQKAYFDIIEGRVEDRFDWLEVIQPAPAS